MYLKKVEIQGFKSFADKIEVIFEKGITGIVGPNGSGKSNISDAVRWVLGEQSAKTLRGSKMEDIIFAGTTQRKPLGMAEVSLTLDNTSNKLPIAYSEVTVTRRMYRSGESEYYINKSLCRLKDIREIFMDTGVGMDGYSIIGQGKIDEILHNKSNDRRLLFEEAAGIVKYKTRKEEAEKKLENTNKNLIRVDDIIKEVESRIEPLRVQSEKAKNFLSLRDQLKNEEIALFIHELESLTYDVKALEEQKHIILDQLESYLDDEKKIEENYEVLKNEKNKIDRTISQLQNNIFETIHLMEKKEGELSLCNEKINNIEENVLRLDGEIKEVKENQGTLSKELGQWNKNLTELDKEINDHKHILSQRAKDLNKISQILKNKEEYMEKYKGNVIEILNQMASKKSEIHGLNALQTNIVKRQNQIKNEKEKWMIEKDQLLEKQRFIHQEIESMEIDFNQSIKNKKEESLEVEKLYNLRKEIREKREKLQQRYQQEETKKTLLKEMENGYEGFHKSVKNILLHIKKNPSLGEGIFVVVAELIRVPRGLEVAMEVALGSAVQNIVCKTPEDANRVINYLKKNNMGRVTFLPLETINGNYLSFHKDDFKNIEGFIGRASDLVTIADSYRKILDHLLAKVIIVDRIENGIILSKKMGNRYRIVSLEGDIINPGGAITGGSYQGKTIHILSRKREIEELGESISILKSQLEEQKERFYENERKIKEFEEELDKKETLLKEKEIAIIHLKNSKNQLSREIQNYQDQFNRVNMEIEQLKKDQEETQIAIQLKEDVIQKMEYDKKEYETNVEENKASYEDEKIQREELNQEVTNFKIRMAAIEEKKDYLNKNIENNFSKQRTLESFKISKEKELKNLIDSKDQLLEQLKELEIQIKDTDVLKQQCEFNVIQEKQKKVKMDQSFEDVEIQLKNIKEKTTELQDSIHKIELKLARLEIQQESYCKKLWEEYEITHQEGLRYKKEDINVGESVKSIKILKNKIKNLGSIHLDSIKEYKEVKERYEFLTSQKEDLLRAKESLNQVIREMEVTMKAQFLEALEIIKKNFNEVFQKLFGGGKATLRLEKEDEVLTTGIEIVAQPPGKKLQNLSLLSGGERSLTAISLLFAILKFKPTPFCILDEIEAALDDANVYRYGDFLKEFSKETQFIVVTHRKGTMESVDALYGVTMQEQGISRMVSVKLREKAS